MMVVEGLLEKSPVDVVYLLALSVIAGRRNWPACPKITTPKSILPAPTFVAHSQPSRHPRVVGILPG